MRTGLAAWPGRRSPISAARSPPQAPAQSKSRRSRSLSPVTGTSTGRPSTQPGRGLFADHKPADAVVGRDAGPAWVLIEVDAFRPCADIGRSGRPRRAERPDRRARADEHRGPSCPPPTAATCAPAADGR